MKKDANKLINVFKRSYFIISILINEALLIKLIRQFLIDTSKYFDAEKPIHLTHYIIPIILHII